MYLGVSGMAFSMLCFAFALEVSAGAVASSAGSSVTPRSSDIMNRTLKGDRLRVIARPAGTEPFGVQLPAPATPQLADGCESAFGPIAPVTVAPMAQRCVT
jgi:hypothetical protein